MNSIKDEINKYHIKKIFGNSVNKIEFILQKTNEPDIPQVFKMPKSKITTSMLDKWIIKNWDYEKDLKTIRLLYKRTQKYLNGKNATHQILEIRNSFNDAFPYLKLKWPCNQAKFDDLVQRINKESIIREQKIEKVIDAAVQFQAMKELKTAINDKIETDLFNASKTILPTLKHSNTGDFYIDGVLYDQKTTYISQKFLVHWQGKINSEEFKKQYGKWLYENQGEDRFDSQNRIYMVSLNENDFNTLSAEDIEKAIQKSNFLTKNYNVNFSYGKADKYKKYKATFKMILFDNFNYV